jgi:methionine-S-sulfoxide reductase
VEQAVFAAGCFWGVQYYFDQIPGVTSTIVGYTGGKTENPTYDDVCYKKTGHAEAVLIEYDAEKVTYETLCRHFFRMHDPTQLNRQGPDVGDQYRSAIFYVRDDERDVAEAVKAKVQAETNRPIVTVIEQLGPFYEAEPEHQKFTERTGRGMCHVPYEPLD